MAGDLVSAAIARGLTRPSFERPDGAGGAGGVGVGQPSFPNEPGAPSFSDVLSSALGDVEATQATADSKAVGLVTGQDIPVHEVMAAATEAEIAVQLTTAIATKAIAAYQDIWKMEI